MTITTSDCKNFLVQNYPATKTSEWKRMSKYKDQHMIVREFSHAAHPPIFVYEYNGQLSLNQPQASTQPSEFSFFMFKYDRNDYSYIVGFCHDDDDEEEVEFLIAPILAPLQLWELEELSDSYYMCNSYDALTLYQKLTAIGMTYDTTGISGAYHVFDPTKPPKPVLSYGSLGPQIYDYLESETDQPLHEIEQNDASRILSLLTTEDLTLIYNMIQNESPQKESWLRQAIQAEYQLRPPVTPVATPSPCMCASDVIRQHLGHR